MKKLSCLVIASALLSTSMLASCTTTSSDAAIQQDLPKVCTALETAHAAFTAIAVVSNKIPAKTIAKESAAYVGVQTLCADPSHTTTINAIFLAAQAYAAVTAALKEAKATQ